MSDMHKLLMNRIRKQEAALGLGLLAEDTEISAFAAPIRNPSMAPAVAPSRASAIEQDIEKYHQEKSKQIFPISKNYNGFQTYFAPGSDPTVPIFICHHGAGSSGLTFTLLAEELQKQWQDNSSENPAKPGIFTFDCRGHGLTTVSTLNFLLEQLTDDFKFVFTEFQKDHQLESTKPNFFFIGHSLGGSVLTNYLLKNPEESQHVGGLVMLDIVEETATQSLTAMPLFIKRRPVNFVSLLRAIEWHIKETGLLHNPESAKVSVPALVYKGKDSRYYWHTDLIKTQAFWETWFQGLSNNFITCGQHVAKLLILAGHENLDTDLIIGQMQGKYQLIAFNNTPNAGHFIHEDIPRQVAISLIDFVRRNVSPEEYMKKELGFVPKWGGGIKSK